MKVSICLPMKGMVPDRFVASLVQRITELSNLGYQIRVAFSDAMPLEYARQSLFEGAEDTDKIVCMDSDIITPSEVLPVLLESPYDVASALYYEKAPPHDHVYRLLGEKGNLVKPSGFLRSTPNAPLLVEGVGLGCCVVKTSILKKLEKPWFHYDWMSKDKTGEDIYFCQKVKSVGGSVAIYPDLVVGHYGVVIPSGLKVND